MKIRRILIPIVLVIAAAILLYWQLSPGPQASSGALEGEVVRVERGDIVIELSASGNVALKRKMALTFKIRGRVERIPVLEGEQVSEDQTLACLETYDLEKSVLQAEAQLKRAEAQLAKVKAGVRAEEVSSAQAAVAIADATVRSAEAAAQRGRANVSSAEAALEAAQASLAKLVAGATETALAIAEKQVEVALNELYGLQGQRDALSRGSVSEYESAKGRVAAAESQVEIYRLQLEELKGGARTEDVAVAEAQVAQAEAALEMAQAGSSQDLAQIDVAKAQAQQARAQLDLLQAGSREEDILSAEAQVAEARSALDQAELALSEVCLSAPFEGLVAEVHVQLNQLVETGQPVITLVDESTYGININVDEADIGRVVEGQQVELVLDAFPDSTVEGRIAYISPLAQEESGIISYQVRVDFLSSDLPLREGLTVNADILARVYEQRLIVPNSAIMVDEVTGLRYVARRTADGPEIVQIETGVQNDFYSEVVSGLSEGDLVVARSSSYREQFRDMMRQSLPGAR